MLSVNNVSKSYGDFLVLKDINLELSKGVYGLLAPNGAGKTTLIKMLTTLLYPAEGEILYDGKDIVKMDEDYRDILGYLPQNFGYYKNYSPTKYLLYLAVLKGIEKKTAKNKVEEVLKSVGLEEVKDKKMKKFSGGMIQRVGIAQAILNDPKVLILDEPTAGLDPKERVRFRNLISELSMNRIVILSTHIVSDLESIANEIIMIKDGAIAYKDNIEGICKMLQGKIYEIEVNFKDIEGFREQYFSLSERQENEKIRVRFICDGKVEGQWEAVYPNLEDVFLYVYKDEQI
ncbi:ABC transporter ATP-binding protein [Clostridium sp. OS1-26]|uniref:ABC transporter ATP-binding protein n=1 Tax=Clostridium sp. OS1-26 TaxID=3070681 RepID=UPI0027E1A2E3|nr:ABC transporter ATP-binding protein [Clostridium sp. OS1-26]WML33270.1 ABC transporter ATP-binding protein [Clostridium sp. OS1-26]